MWLHRENCAKDSEWSTSRAAGEPIRHRDMYLVSFTWATHWVQQAGRTTHGCSLYAWQRRRTRSFIARPAQETEPSNLSRRALRPVRLRVTREGTLLAARSGWLLAYTRHYTGRYGLRTAVLGSA